ncbi:MAG: hypothetical protein ACOY4R_25160 [Pseudomonadota bacterium]
MTDWRHSAERWADEEGKAIRVVLIGGCAEDEEILGAELPGANVTVLQTFADEQAVFDGPEALRRADLIVLGASRSISAILSLSVRLKDAGVTAPIVNVAGIPRSLDGSARRLTGLKIDGMLDELRRLAVGIAEGSEHSRHLAGGDLRLQQGRFVRWKNFDVPLTAREFRIVRLLASDAGEYVSYDTIYGAAHASPASGPGKRQRRSLVRLAVRRIIRKFAERDPAFSGIEGHADLGYRWLRSAPAGGPSGKIIKWPRERRR